jgi:hypothetical protein
MTGSLERIVIDKAHRLVNRALGLRETMDELRG